MPLTRKWPLVVYDRGAHAGLVGGHAVEAARAAGDVGALGDDGGALDLDDRVLDARGVLDGDVELGRGGRALVVGGADADGAPGPSARTSSSRARRRRPRSRRCRCRRSRTRSPRRCRRGRRRSRRTGTARPPPGPWSGLTNATVGAWSAIDVERRAGDRGEAVGVGDAQGDAGDGGGGVAAEHLHAGALVGAVTVDVPLVLGDRAVRVGASRTRRSRRSGPAGPRGRARPVPS